MITGVDTWLSQPCNREQWRKEIAMQIHSKLYMEKTDKDRDKRDVELDRQISPKVILDDPVNDWAESALS